MIFLKMSFGRLCQYLGRNGYGHQHGLLVWEQNRITRFAPINSKGGDSAAQIQIPTEELPTLIAALQRIQAEHESRQA